MKKLILTSILFLAGLGIAHGQDGAINLFCDLGAAHSMTSGLPSSNYLQGIIPQCTVAVYYTGTTTLAPIYTSNTGTATVLRVNVNTGGNYSVCPTGVSFSGGSGSGAAATVACTGTAITSVTVTNPGSGYQTPPTVAFTGGTGVAGTATAVLTGDLANPFTARTDGSFLFFALANQGYDVTMYGGLIPNTYPTPRTLIDIYPSQGFNVTAGLVSINSQTGPALTFQSSGNTVAITNPSTNVFNFEAVGGSSSCGTVSGDNTSTDCGYQNRLSDTATIPANDSTFGYTNLDVNAARNTVAVGTTNGAYTTGNIAGLIGTSNAVGDTGGNCSLLYSYLLGYRNVSGGDAGTTTGVCKGVTLNQVFIGGNDNLNFTSSPGAYYFQDVIIGAYNLNTDMAGQTLAGQELDNSQIIGNTAARGIAGSSIVCIGDSACDNHAQAQINNIYDTVAIGFGTGSGMPDGTTGSTFVGEGAGSGEPTHFGHGDYGHGIDQTGIGFEACVESTGTRTVCIGRAAIAGVGVLSGSLLGHNTGTDNIGIGTSAGRSQSTGSHNVYLGELAGCDGCDANTTTGNGNKTGSYQVDIGYHAGPGTTSQLDNIIAIGKNAFADQSDETVIGNSFVTKLVIFGSGDGCLSSTSGVITGSGSACGSGGSAAFSALTSGTNTIAAMLVGTGASLGYTGSGSIDANQLTGITISGTPSAGQVLTATSPTAASWSSPAYASAEVVAYSATPTFSTAYNTSRIVLTGNITSFTLGAGLDGQDKTLCFQQGAGAYTVIPPANVHGFFTVGNMNSLWNCQSFNYDATDSIWLATTLGVFNE